MSFIVIARATAFFNEVILYNYNVQRTKPSNTSKMNCKPSILSGIPKELSRFTICNHLSKSLANEIIIFLLFTIAKLGTISLC